MGELGRTQFLGAEVVTRPPEKDLLVGERVS
jgi:hypothetical protein